MSQLPHDQYRATLESLTAQLHVLLSNPPSVSPSTFPVRQHGVYTVQPASTSDSVSTATKTFLPTAASAMPLGHGAHHQALTHGNGSSIPLSALTAAALRLSQASDEMNLLILQCRMAALSGSTAAQGQHEHEQNGPLRLSSSGRDGLCHGCRGCSCHKAIDDISRVGNGASPGCVEHGARNGKHEYANTDSCHGPCDTNLQGYSEDQTGAAQMESHQPSQCVTTDCSNTICQGDPARDHDLTSAVNHLPVSQALSKVVPEGPGEAETSNMDEKTGPDNSFGLFAADTNVSRCHSHSASHKPETSSDSSKENPLPSPIRLPLPPAPFTNMLDVNEPRYFPPALSPSVNGKEKERRLCRAVIISGLPRSVCTLSAVLRRVRGGTVIRARIVDLSAWPVFQSSAASHHRGSDHVDGHCLPSASTAQVEFADPREAAAYVSHVNDTTQVDKDALFSICRSVDCRHHAASRSPVRVQLAGTPSYPLPAYLHRMIQTEGATRCVVVRCQVSSTTCTAPSSNNSDHDDGDSNNVREPEQLAESAVNAAAGEVVEKTMALLERRFLSTWPHRRGGKERGERYALLEDAWVEQDFAPIRADDGASLGDTSNRGNRDDEFGGLVAPDKHESSPGREADRGEHKQTGTRTSTSSTAALKTTTTTVHLHLNFCKLEHAIRAASALRYQIRPPSVQDTTCEGGGSSEASVAVGFARDACAGDLEELQDVAAASISVSSFASPGAGALAASVQIVNNGGQEEAGGRDAPEDQTQVRKVNILGAWKNRDLPLVLGEIFPGFPSNQEHVNSVGYQSINSSSTTQGSETHEEMEDLLDLSTENNSSSLAEQDSESSPTSPKSPSFWSTFTPVPPTDTKPSVQSSASGEAGVEEESKTRAVVVDGTGKAERVRDGFEDDNLLL